MSSSIPASHLAAGRPSGGVSIVLPCLNEAATVGACIDRALAYFQASGRVGEVVVVDNGSCDGSERVAVAAGARVVHAKRRGYGATLRAGIEAAHHELVVMMDADGTYAQSPLEPYVAGLEGGSDLVIGDRYAGGIAPGAMPWLHRVVGTPALTMVARKLFGASIRDINCGLRSVRRSRFLALGCRCDGMDFASEMVLRATLHRLRVLEAPAELHPGPVGRRPHLRPIRDGLRHLRTMLMLYVQAVAAAARGRRRIDRAHLQETISC